MPRKLKKSIKTQQIAAVLRAGGNIWGRLSLIWQKRPLLTFEVKVGIIDAYNNLHTRYTRMWVRREL